MGSTGIIVRGVITLAVLGAAVTLTVLGVEYPVELVWALAGGSIAWWAPSPLQVRR